MDQLTPNDLLLLQSALAELQAAQNVAGFAQAHIGRVYKMKEGDRVAKDGTIERAPVVKPGVGIDS